MTPLEMVDSDLYQHMLSVESEHKITSPNNYIYTIYSSGLGTPSTTNSTISVSSLCSTTTTNASSASISLCSTTNASSTSISSLSNISDDDVIYITQQETEIIDGGVQRALVIMYDDDNNDNNNSNNKNKHKDKYDNINANDYKCKCVNENINENEIDNEYKINTFSFKSWINSYKNQPHRILNNSRKRNRKYFEKRNKSKFGYKIDKQLLIYITNLRHSLPYNPLKTKYIIKNQNKQTQNTICDNINIHTHTPYEINEIQQKILHLQNQLEDIRNLERMKIKLNNWKNFKLNWSNWRLIDFYEYLLRINGRKYAKYLLNFEIFYLQWMSIYDIDQKSITHKHTSRFMSHIFNGQFLINLSHNDLIIFGINSKEDRRQILIKIMKLQTHKKHK